MPTQRVTPGDQLRQLVGVGADPDQRVDGGALHPGSQAHGDEIVALVSAATGLEWDEADGCRSLVGEPVECLGERCQPGRHAVPVPDHHPDRRRSAALAAIGRECEHRVGAHHDSVVVDAEISGKVRRLVVANAHRPHRLEQQTGVLAALFGRERADAHHPGRRRYTMGVGHHGEAQPEGEIVVIVSNDVGAIGGQVVLDQAAAADQHQIGGSDDLVDVGDVGAVDRRQAAHPVHIGEVGPRIGHHRNLAVRMNGPDQRNRSQENGVVPCIGESVVPRDHDPHRAHDASSFPDQHSQDQRGPGFDVLSSVICHLSSVICHLSSVICHLSSG